MRIELLRVRDFRNYREAVLTPHPGVNLFFGQNGSGKTNLLEAVHYCALGRSHRTAQDRDVVRRGQPAGACSVTAVSEQGGRSEIMIRLSPDEPRRKQVWIDRKKAPRLADLMGHVRCVVFSPEDLSLVREGPSVRRRYLDMLISQLDPLYFTALQRYSRALEERNALLRNSRRTGALRDELFAPYEQIMAETGAEIIRKRAGAMDRISAAVRDRYTAVCGRDSERFSVVYEPCLPAEEAGAERLSALFAGKRQDDALRGTTGAGVHREDLLLRLNGREMKPIASQGQVRTAALAMKLAQMRIFEEETGEPPVLLLDDVMSELDMNRRSRLLREISGAQTFITCTDESDLDGCEERRTYRVFLGEEQEGRVEETRAGEKAEEETGAAEEPDFS